MKYPLPFDVFQTMFAMESCEKGVKRVFKGKVNRKNEEMGQGRNHQPFSNVSANGQG